MAQKARQTTSPGRVSDIERYFAAAQISALPTALREPRHIPLDQTLRARAYERVVAATKIWCAADNDAGRREALARFVTDCADAELAGDLTQILDRYLKGSARRLPPLRRPAFRSSRGRV